MDELNQAIAEYRGKWEKLLSERADKEYFSKLRPTAVCLKLAELSELDGWVKKIREHADHIHGGWINERWLVTAHLKDVELDWGIKIVKLYQRRPGSGDALGLDHLDFLAEGGADENVLSKEPSLKWTHESNGPHCSWISLWFEGTEAKLRTDTTLNVCAKELLELDEQIKGTR
jgi:hypothetical protein